MAEIMACHLMAPSHYLNHCWLQIIDTIAMQFHKACSKYVSKIFIQNQIFDYIYASAR